MESNRQNIGRTVGQRLLPENLDAARVVFELLHDMSHGDLAKCGNDLGKPAQKLPRDLAAMFAAEFEKIDGVTGVEIAGLGFVNLRILPIYGRAKLLILLKEWPTWTKSNWSRYM